MFAVKVLFAFLGFLLLYFLWKRRKYYLLAFKIQGPLGYPLIGMAHKLMKRADIIANLAEYEHKYGNSYFYSWLGPMPILIVIEPQIAQEILNSTHCVNKGFMYKAITDGTGGGLFCLKEPEWSRQRKLINPAFSHKVLLSFMPIFNKETFKLIKILDEHVGKNEVDILKILQGFTLTISAKTTMDHDLCNEGDPKDFNLLNYYQCIQQNMTEMIFSPWLMLTFVRVLLRIYVPYNNAKKQIRLFIRNLIAQKISEDSFKNQALTSKIEENKFFINSVIELYKKGDLTYEQIEDQSNIIVFGAFETTSNTIAYTLILLAMFPQYQQKLFNEIKTFFPNNGDFVVTMADTHELVYMDMVLNETMRLMAPVPLIAREATSDVTLSNGVTLPAGIQIAIDIFNMQRRVDIWGPDADKFNPEHFLPSNLENIHPYAFMPFTKGIRNCIGWRYATLSIKTTLSKLIRNYHFKTNFNFEDLHFVEDITLKLRKIPLLEIERRLD